MHKRFAVLVLAGTLVATFSPPEVQAQTVAPAKSVSTVNVYQNTGGLGYSQEDISDTAFSAAGSSFDLNEAFSGSLALLRPSVFATATSVDAEADGEARMTFDLIVSGSPGVLVPLHIVASGNSSVFPDETSPYTFVEGEGIMAFSSDALLTPPGQSIGFSTSFGQFCEGYAGVFERCGSAEPASAFNLDDTFMVPSQVPIHFSLLAFASAAVGSANASIDPYFYIEPSFVDRDKFNIVLSDGVGNTPLTSGVPEPSMWVVLLLGFGMIGCARRGRSSLTVRRTA